MSLMIVTPVSVSPAMIARSTGAAPRQRGSSDGWTLSHRWRARRPAGTIAPYAHVTIGVGGKLHGLVESLGLKHRDAELLGGDLRRRRIEPPPAARRPIGLRQAERDVVPRREPLEDVGSERCRRSEADQRGHAYRRAPSAERCRSIAMASRRASSVVRSIMSTPSR